MSRWWTVGGLALALMALGRSSGAEAPPTRVGIFTLNVVGLDPAMVQTAIDALATAVGNVPGFTVVSRNELNAMLGAEQLKDVLGCTDISCMAEIGMAAGVDRIVAGSMSRVEQKLVISLQLVNVRYANVENRVTLEWSGELGAVSNVLGAGAELLVLPGEARQPGTLTLSGIPAQAIVSLDGKPVGVGVTEVAALPVGVHALRVEADGYEPKDLALVIRHGATTHLPVNLTEKAASPFYATWWFWTGAVAVVAGSVTAAVLLAGGSANEDPSGLRVVSAF